MLKLIALSLAAAVALTAADLPAKKYLNLPAVKAMVAGAEAEAAKRNVNVTMCIVDEGGNLLFLQKGDKVSLSTIDFAQKKARHAAMYRRPSAAGAETLKKGDLSVLTYPNYFPNQGGLPILVDGELVGAIACSGSKSEIDEAVAQAGIDALLRDYVKAEGGK
ncbi:MAG: GlcG/HbpS family heme-binding protein [Bryobacteraceae bacterium]